MKPENSLQAASNLLAGLIGIFVGLAISGFEGIEAWLNTWQTMIAGLLAIIAAIIALFATFTVDKRQHARHMDQLRLVTRADGLRAERAATRAEFIEEMLGNAPEPPEVGSGYVSNLLQDFKEEYAAWLAKMDLEVRHKSILGASDLFDGNVVWIEEDVVISLTVARETAEYMPGPLDASNRAAQWLQEMQLATDQIAGECHKFCDELRRLGQTYKS